VSWWVFDESLALFRWVQCKLVVNGGLVYLFIFLREVVPGQEQAAAGQDGMGGVWKLSPVDQG
jgi:hypothetical protein